MSQNTDLLTVRAAIRRALETSRPFINAADMLNVTDAEHYADVVLATLSDPAVMDELARWLIEQEDGPFEPMISAMYPTYRLRQRTRNEGT